MSQLENQVAIVTGASGGFGEGIAHTLVQRGAKVYITARKAEKLQAAAGRTGATPLVADVTVPADWDRVFSHVLAENGRVDLLVNNAGAGVHIGPLDELSDADIAQTIQVNLTGQIFGCRRAAEAMKRQKSGTIVNVLSVCARKAWAGWGVYSAAKAGAMMLSKCLALELREHGVRVTSVMPSWGNTEFTDAAGLAAHQAEVLRQCIQPAELGDLVAYIAALPPHLQMQDVTLWPMIQPLDSL